MKIFIAKAMILFVITYVIVISVNYRVNPAHIFTADRIIDNMVEKLSEGNIIYSPGDLDEGLFNEKLIFSLRENPDVLIIGSSHVMYIPWEYENYFVFGLSGAYLGDYYALIGLVQSSDIMPKKVVFGVDPWAFMTSYENGRHASLKHYALDEYQRINGVDYIYEGNFTHTGSWSLNIAKVKEIVSFPYFQSSVRAVRKNGIQYYLSKPDSEVLVAENNLNEHIAKILPNGLRIMSVENFGTPEQNTIAAEHTVEQGSIYQLGKELTEVDAENFSDFENLVKYLQEKGISVELYLPSWYPTLYDYFKREDKFSGVLEVESAVRDLGNRYGITVHGSYNPDLCGVTVDDFADYLHLKSEEGIRNYNFILEE